jgi:hypothetical protein
MFVDYAFTLFRLLHISYTTRVYLGIHEALRGTDKCRPGLHSVIPYFPCFDDMYIYLEAASPTKNAQMSVCCGFGAWYIRNTCPYFTSQR